jgi:hypothetical protein
MIKKKNTWHNDTPPAMPYAPERPTESWIREVIEDVWSGDRVKLSDVKLPDGVKLDDLVIESRGDEGSCASIGVVRIVETKNTYFEHEMKCYEKKLLKHEAKMVKWKDDVEQWKQWKNENDESRLEARLSAAEALLKKHGRL